MSAGFDSERMNVVCLRAFGPDKEIQSREDTSRRTRVGLCELAPAAGPAAHVANAPLDPPADPVLPAEEAGPFAPEGDDDGPEADGG